jgi:hypothetical protein
MIQAAFLANGSRVNQVIFFSSFVSCWFAAPPHVKEDACMIPVDILEGCMRALRAGLKLVQTLSVPLQLEVLVRKVLAVKKAKVAEAAKAAKDTATRLCCWQVLCVH